MSVDYMPIKEIKKSDFDFDLLNSNQPVVIRGLVDDWPLVQASSSSIEDLISHILCYYEGDNEEEKKEEFLKKGNIGDQIHYFPNNQLGILYYEITLNNNKKELKLIGDYDGFFDDPNYPQFI